MGLTQTVYDVAEDVGMVEVCVEIQHGSIAPSFHVNLTTTDGTASKGCVYTISLKIFRLKEGWRETRPGWMHVAMVMILNSNKHMPYIVCNCPPPPPPPPWLLATPLHLQYICMSIVRIEYYVMYNNIHVYQKYII